MTLEQQQIFAFAQEKIEVLEKKVDDLASRFHPLVRARNEFFYKLRNDEQMSKEELILLFEKTFNVSRIDFDNAKVYKWDEMPEKLKKLTK